ncbi:hypothetical protein FQR65_LT12229 [Abscondita terminalis]|nr:hypothetical protein FQR65_LT12229 [Abscondita terminalis]
MLRTSLVLLSCLVLNAYGKLEAISEPNTLSDCILKLIQQAIDGEMPLAFVLTDNDTGLIPNQYEVAYTVVKIENTEKLKFLVDTQFVMFIKSEEVLENTIIALDLALTSYRKAAKNRILLITDSMSADKIFEKMWTHKIINVAIIYHDKKCCQNNPPVIFTSNPFDAENLCGNASNVINSQDCNQTINFMKHVNFNNCTTGLVSFHKGFKNNIIDVTNMFVLDQLEKHFNTTIILPRPDFSKFSKSMLITYFSNDVYDKSDKVIIFSDDFVWVSPVFKKSTMMQKIYDNLTWIMILFSFLIVSVCWSLTNEVSSSVLEVWSLTLTGCVSRIPSPSYLKTIFVLYIFYVIIMRSLFESNLIKSLTISDYLSDVSTIQDVINSKLPLLINDVVAFLYFTEKIPSNVLYTEVQKKISKSYYGLEQSIFYKNCTTLIYRYVVESFQASTNIKVNYFTDNSLTGQYKVWICLGIYTKTMLDYGREHYRHIDIEYDPLIDLNLQHLYGIFVVWVIGIMVSIVVFVVEKLYFLLTK